MVTWEQAVPLLVIPVVSFLVINGIKGVAAIWKVDLSTMQTGITWFLTTLTLYLAFRIVPLLPPDVQWWIRDFVVFFATALSASGIHWTFKASTLSAS